MQQIVPKSSSSECNTNNSSPKKQVSPALKWCFTLNNYTDDDCVKIQSSIKEICKLGFFNKEVGKSGTPHLQGYIEFWTKDRPINKFGIPRIHWETARKGRDANFKYCSKDANGRLEEMTFSYGYKQKKKLRVIKDLHPWQAKVLELVDKELREEDDRTINWVIDKQGCAGKTAFCKFVTTVKQQLMIITGGGYKDIACCLNLFMQDEDKDINDDTVVFFNIPREADEKGLISYRALESLKDGLMTSTKYESRTLVFNSPSVWVFSNSRPELDKLSKDRWKLWTITNNELVKYENKCCVIESDDESS